MKAARALFAVATRHRLTTGRCTVEMGVMLISGFDTLVTWPVTLVSGHVTFGYSRNRFEREQKWWKRSWKGSYLGELERRRLRCAVLRISPHGFPIWYIVYRLLDRAMSELHVVRGRASENKPSACRSALILRFTPVISSLMYGDVRSCNEYYQPVFVIAPSLGFSRPLARSLSLRDISRRAYTQIHV